jgi:hypothetical protein
LPGGRGCGLAGQGHEHLVEAGLAKGEFSDSDARASELGDRGRCPLTCRPPRAAVRDHGRQQSGVGFVADWRAEQPGEQMARLGPLRRVGQPDAQGSRAGGGLERAWCPLGDHRAVVDDRDPGAEPVGFVEVLGGEQHCRPVCGQCADDLVHLCAAGRVEPGGRFIQEIHLGPRDQAGG